MLPAASTATSGGGRSPTRACRPRAAARGVSVGREAGNVRGMSDETDDSGPGDVREILEYEREVKERERKAKEREGAERGPGGRRRDAAPETPGAGLDAGGVTEESDRAR